MSESRIRRNRIRRIRQLRMRLSIAVMTLGIVVSASLIIGTLHTNAQDNKVVPTYKYYKSILVNYGDTLSGLAENLEIPENEREAYILEVMNINSIMEEEDIRAGEYLVVPYYSEEFLG